VAKVVGLQSHGHQKPSQSKSKTRQSPMHRSWRTLLAARIISPESASPERGTREICASGPPPPASPTDRPGSAPAVPSNPQFRSTLAPNCLPLDCPYEMNLGLPPRSDRRTSSSTPTPRPWLLASDLRNCPGTPVQAEKKIDTPSEPRTCPSGERGGGYVTYRVNSLMTLSRCRPENGPRSLFGRPSGHRPAHFSPTPTTWPAILGLVPHPAANVQIIAIKRFLITTQGLGPHAKELDA